MSARSICAGCAVLFLATAGAAADEAARQAREILDATGVRGGLVVHVGCGDGKLTAALRANDRFLVHGLNGDAANLAAARQHIRTLGVYGKVSVARWAGKSLPYADDMVNLLVAGDPKAVAKAEALRVLVPGGVAWLGGERIVKPRPADIDEWTHYLHDASNNAVARDTRVAAPRRMKWVCGPLWTRSHEFTSSLIAMVSGGGRLFYLFDEGLTGVTPAFLPQRWTLIARDAFNGVLLWRRPIEDWRAGVWKGSSLRGIPPSVPRLLVAENDRVFFPLKLGAAISILDAATGKVLAECEGTEGAQELRCLDGVLLVRVGSGELAAFDTQSGKRMWAVEDKPRPQTLAAAGAKVVYLSGAELVCLAMKTGAPQWRVAADPSAKAGGKASGKARRRPRASASLLLVHGERILLAARGSLRAVSVASGKALWSAPGRLGGRGELFVAQGKAWRWEEHHFVGHDLATGKIAASVNADDVFTPGHHLRCYQGKATENYIIAPWRGVEFVSLTGGEHTQNDWLRGPCGYGVMPCNGLLYAPPNPCFCYPGVKVIGFNVLAPAAKASKKTPAGPRLEKGPAFSGISDAESRISDAEKGDWPTYRHDALRTGRAGCDVPADAAPRWTVRLPGPLSPPVAAGGRLFVTAKDEHTVYALDVRDGKEAWHFTADGRIDSPPTVHAGRVLFGCADGRVYCLRAADGALAWRFLAAPAEELIFAFGQLESRWRVHGSVLVDGNAVYCTAGRSTMLDGGIRVFALDVRTGKPLHEKTLHTWSRTREDAAGKPFVPAYHMEGSNSDVLVRGGDGCLYMGQYRLNTRLEEQSAPYVLPGEGEKVETMDLTGKPFVDKDVAKTQPLEVHQRKWLENAARPLVAALREKHGAFNIGHRRMGLRVFATSGFLDDSWYNRTYWMYSESWPGYYLAHRGAKTGQLLVVGPERTYVVQAYPHRNMQSPLFTPGETGYLLFADDNGNEPVLSDQTRETTKGWGFTRKAPPVWHAWVPVRIRAMTLAGKALFVAGPPDAVKDGDPMAAFDGRMGSVLCVHSTETGKKLSERKLDAPPVFDGLIAAAGRLFLCTTDGRVVCFGK